MQTTRHLASSRRFRPQKFSEIVGQAAVVTTLRNAIVRGMTAHAYIFSGIHGTGKTTLARIIAKALNCTALSGDGEPCNMCSSCREIAQGESLDVIEIDGASNRGIDDIRAITETLPYNSGKSRYKIIIIDEVHMLTKEAFNALLKSLEEPPAHVKFFFATTEPLKIPATILSRCQRFDLERIKDSDIARKLKFIADDLGRPIDDAALDFLAVLAEGSLRSAESMLDQLFAYEKDSVSIEKIQKLLGYPTSDLFFSLDEAYHQSKAASAFLIADTVFMQGVHIPFFLEGLIGHFRTAVKLSLSLSTHTSLPQHLRDGYQKALSIYTPEKLFEILDFLALILLQEKKFPTSKVHLEMVLHRIIQTKTRPTLQEIQEALLGHKSRPAPPVRETPPPSAQLSSAQLLSAPPLAAPLQESAPKRTIHHDTVMQFAAVELEGTIKHL